MQLYKKEKCSVFLNQLKKMLSAAFLKMLYALTWKDSYCILSEKARIIHKMGSHFCFLKEDVYTHMKMSRRPHIKQASVLTVYGDVVILANTSFVQGKEIL